MPDDPRPRAGIDPCLNHGYEKERRRGDEEAGSNFSQGSQTDKFFKKRIEPVREERQHDEDKNRVNGLNLG